jgi:hypothetical protein
MNQHCSAGFKCKVLLLLQVFLVISILMGEGLYMVIKVLISCERQTTLYIYYGTCPELQVNPAGL